MLCKLTSESAAVARSASTPRPCAPANRSTVCDRLLVRRLGASLDVSERGEGEDEPIENTKPREEESGQLGEKDDGI